MSVVQGNGVCIANKNLNPDLRVEDNALIKILKPNSKQILVFKLYQHLVLREIFL